MGLRAAAVEDVRDAIARVTNGLADTSARQYVLRVKSLLACAHKLGFTPFNPGATIKVRSDAAHRGASLAKRIITEVEVGLLMRATPSKRDRVMIEVTYAAGLRAASELSALPGPTFCPQGADAAFGYRQGQQGAPGAVARDRRPPLEEYNTAPDDAEAAMAELGEADADLDDEEGYSITPDREHMTAAALWERAIADPVEIERRGG